jgi:hypothetical protein
MPPLSHTSADLTHEPCQRISGARQVIVPEGPRPALRGARGGACRLLNGPAHLGGMSQPSLFLLELFDNSSRLLPV